MGTGKNYPLEKTNQEDQEEEPPYPPSGDGADTTPGSATREGSSPKKKRAIKALLDAGCPEDKIPDAFAYAESDPETTNVEGRLATAYYAQKVVQAIKPRPGSSVWDRPVTGMADYPRTDRQGEILRRELDNAIRADHQAGEHQEPDGRCPYCPTVGGTAPTSILTSSGREVVLQPWRQR